MSEPPLMPRAQRGARLRRLREAHLLAGRVCDYYAERGTRVAPRERQDFQRALILRTAAALGYRARSRRDLSAAQLARVCTSLREQMEERGIPLPEAKRKPDAPTGSQWKQLTLLFARAKSALGWDQAHCNNFSRRQLGGRLRPRTRAQANALIRGLDGVLRHANKEGP